MEKLYLLICMAAVLLSCSGKPAGVSRERQEYTGQQEALLQQGWTAGPVENGDLSEKYGYEPKFGLQDNYFDITMGEGSSVAVN